MSELTSRGWVEYYDVKYEIVVILRVSVWICSCVSDSIGHKRANWCEAGRVKAPMSKGFIWTTRWNWGHMLGYVERRSWTTPCSNV